VRAQISHPLIVAFHGAMQDKSNVYFLLAYYPGGDLAYHLSKHGALKTSAVRFFAAEVLLAVQYLHQQRIVVRDLKPENILLDARGHVRLTDFGLSKPRVSCWTQGATTMCGTEPYVG
ncbi:kinase-like domain-containing protein, partial [Tribonema minus]